MRVSVVIPTYNQARLLQLCLRSLLAQTLALPDYEVVVVDDGSTDATLETAGTLGGTDARVRAVRFEANRGRSAARNAGVRAATAPLIVFVDSDIIVRPDFLEAHLRAQAHGPGVVSRGPVVLVPSLEAIRSARIPRVFASPAFLDTANAGVEKAAIERAGGFDERFPGYGWEDVDLGQRLRRLGVRRVFSAAAVAFHLQPPMREDELPALLAKEEERARSAAYFFRKSPSVATRLLIQATPVHRLAYWLLTAGGLISERNAAAVAGRLRRMGLDAAAYLAMRGVLNRHYVRMLQGELHQA